MLDRLVVGRKELSAWYAYNLGALDPIRAKIDGVLVINYNALMDGDSELDRLRRFVDTKLTDQRKAYLYWSRENSSRIFRLLVLLQRLLAGRDLDKLFRQIEQLRV